MSNTTRRALPGVPGAGESHAAMESLIPVLNKLYDVMSSVGAGGKLKLNLPQIVVIGSQSAGKSSVLESLVGRDFLPRGSGVVTRRPLILQLVHTQGDGADWAQFMHKPAVRFTDFGQVRQEIVAETERVTGRNKGISRLPINLKVFSKNVVDLTLVDLPGITRVPMGDQPADIEEQIRAMCLEYITQSNTIILAVTPGNVDLSTSDAIQLARRADPAGQRTIGVITKLDLMDRGTDAYDVLAGRTIPLKLGYIGVVCRSQHDIDSGRPVEDALAAERHFFESHPRYSRIADRCGTQYLAKTLNSVFLRHIRATLPDLKQRVTKMLGDARAAYAQLQNPLIDADTPAGRGAALLQMLTRFSTEFGDSLAGTLKDMPGKTLFGGAKLRHVFVDQFGRAVDELEPFAGLGPDQIQTVIRNASGTRTALFIPEAAFESLAKRQIALLEEPAMECLDHVYDELRMLLDQLEDRCFASFRNLRDAVGEAVNALLAANREPARRMIHNLIQIELAHINTAHPDFIGGDRAIAVVVEKLRGPSSSGGAGAASGAAASSAAAASPAQQAKGPKQKCPICSEVLPYDSAVIQEHMARHNAQQQRTGSKPAVASAFSSGASQDARFDTELVRTLLDSYFAIVKKNIRDTVPKAVMHFLVGKTAENLHNHLVQSLYSDQVLQKLLEESPEVTEKRAVAKQNLDILERASKIISDIRGINV